MQRARHFKKSLIATQPSRNFCTGKEKVKHIVPIQNIREIEEDEGIERLNDLEGEGGESTFMRKLDSTKKEE
jgi:hypothetical protein